MLNLMYITNDPVIAAEAVNAGVDRVFIDTEVLGKTERQGHLDSVKSNHLLSDILTIREVVADRAQILARINPFHQKTRDEINEAIDNGADIIMLPMWKTVCEVEEFCKYVDGRAITIPLLETKEADDLLEDVLKLRCVDELYIGLNDLHLSYKKRFMFELLADGTVDRLCEMTRAYGVPYGFGGVGRPGTGILPAVDILGEHYRLGSQSVILSRQFCKSAEPIAAGQILHEGIRSVRMKEQEFLSWSEEDFENNRIRVQDTVSRIVAGMEK